MILKNLAEVKHWFEGHTFTEKNHPTTFKFQKDKLIIDDYLLFMSLNFEIYSEADSYFLKLEPGKTNVKDDFEIDVTNTDFSGNTTLTEKISRRVFTLTKFVL
jgi:hypothetical protein